MKTTFIKQKQMPPTPQKKERVNQRAVCLPLSRAQKPAGKKSVRARLRTKEQVTGSGTRREGLSSEWLDQQRLLKSR